MQIELKCFHQDQLPSYLSVEDIKKGFLYKRNSTIVDFLSRIDTIEDYASGVRRVF